MTEEEYIGIVGEIFDGYSEFEFFGVPIYLKHFSIRDQRYIHRFYEKYKNIALNKGIPSEKDALNQLRQDNLWTDQDDLKIASLEKEIESLKETRNNLMLPSQKDQYQNTIEERTSELLRLRINRKEVIGKTAEDYASSRANEEFIRYIIYKDKDLKEHFFTDKEFENLTDSEIGLLLQCYKSCNEKLNEEIIQEAVLRDFFNMYLSLAENVSTFYGKPIIYLSVHQLKLALYARVFFNIFQYNEDIPNNIKKDPAAILRFSESKRNQSEGKNKLSNSDSSATAVFGATKEDLSFVDPDARPTSISDIIQKEGGSLNMEQLMNLMG